VELGRLQVRRRRKKRGRDEKKVEESTSMSFDHKGMEVNTVFTM